jgi:hypothetical protein
MEKLSVNTTADGLRMIDLKLALASASVALMITVWFHCIVNCLVLEIIKLRGVV